MDVISLDMCLLRDHFLYDTNNSKIIHHPGFLEFFLPCANVPYNANTFALLSILSAINNYVSALI